MSTEKLPDLGVLSRSGAAPAGAPRAPFVARVIVPLLVLIGAAGLLGFLAIDLVRPRAEIRVATVRTRGTTDVVEGGSIATAAVVQAPGWIEPEPFAISVPALADGVIKEVLVLEGQEVEAGQVVARMIDEDAVLEERGAAAMCVERRAEVERAKAAVVRAEAELEAEQAETAAQRDEIETKRNLTNPGSMGESRNRQSETRLAGQEAKVKAAMAAVQEMTAAVGAAEGALTRAEAMHEAAVLKKARMEIKAPLRGVVLSRLVAPGSHIMLAAMSDMKPEVVKLYDPAKLQVRVDVPLAEAAGVSVGQEAEVTTEALPRRTFKGKVMRLLPEASVQKNTVQVKVTIENPDPLLRPEMLARVRFLSAGATAQASPSGLDPAALFVPVGALRKTEGDRAMVWVFSRPKETATPREVRLGGIVTGGWRHVISGLTEGEEVLMQTPPGLTETTKLRVAAPDGGAAS